MAQNSKNNIIKDFCCCKNKIKTQDLIPAIAYIYDTIMIYRNNNNKKND